MLGQAIRYSLTLPLSAALSLGIPVALHELLAVPEQIAVAAGLIAVLTFSFLVNRRFVFRVCGDSWRQMWRHIWTQAAFRVGEYAAFLVLFEGLGLHYLAALVAVLTVSVCGKFAAQRHYVFRDRSQNLHL